MMKGWKFKRSGSFQFLIELYFFLVIYFAVCKYSDYNLSFTNFWINCGEEVLGCEPLLPDSSRFHRRHHRTAKGFYGSRPSYYSNSTALFQQAHLLISGGVSVNPGPDKVHSTRTVLQLYVSSTKMLGVLNLMLTFVNFKTLFMQIILTLSPSLKLG